MKRMIAVFLSFALMAMLCFTASADGQGEKTYGAYKHVFIVGIDGAGTFFKNDYMTNFHRIIDNGTVKYEVRTETKTDSGPNWTSILTGVSYFKHGAENGVVGGSQKRLFKRYPSIFSMVHNAMPDAELASINNWDAINIGIVEDGIGATKISVGPDSATVDAIVDYFNEGHAPAVFFTQLDEVDAAGHGFGSASVEYENAMKEADERIGVIYDCLRENGLLDDGLFIVTADHGHKATGGHGRFSKIESYSTIAVAGKTVVSGGTMDKDVKLRDIAAISLYALGVKPNGWSFSARVPSNLFTDVKGQIRPYHGDLIDLLCGGFMWIYTNLGHPLDKFF
ncbi:MAG: alkaline phosphatase family protein [Lachnospiraceae bacterium]|nr:alkaline phosphatase family protein [Lachnospiraceae bacterium]